MDQALLQRDLRFVNFSFRLHFSLNTVLYAYLAETKLYFISVWSIVIHRNTKHFSPEFENCCLLFKSRKTILSNSMRLFRITSIVHQLFSQTILSLAGNVLANA